MAWRLAILGGLAAAWTPLAASLHTLYLREARAELAKPFPFPPATMDSAALAGLPEPVRRYFAHCRFAGMRSMRNARFDWKDFSMRFSRGKGWTRVRVRQLNSVPEPARFVHLRARMGGAIPLNGRDKYQDGRGHMLIRAAGLFKVADARSPRMDQSALATFLAEIPLVPSAALQPYVRWESIDSASARAVIRHGGTAASGVFSFNPAGEFVSFRTEDRWQDGKDDAPVPWSIGAGEYRDMGGFLLPTRFTATWHEKEGDFNYFRGTLRKIEFDAEEP